MWYTYITTTIISISPWEPQRVRRALHRAVILHTSVSLRFRKLLWPGLSIIPYLANCECDHHSNIIDVRVYVRACLGVCGAWLLCRVLVRVRRVCTWLGLQAQIFLLPVCHIHHSLKLIERYFVPQKSQKRPLCVWRQKFKYSWKTSRFKIKFTSQEKRAPRTCASNGTSGR